MRCLHRSKEQISRFCLHAARELAVFNLRDGVAVHYISRTAELSIIQVFAKGRQVAVKLCGEHATVLIVQDLYGVARSCEHRQGVTEKDRLDFRDAVGKVERLVDPIRPKSEHRRSISARPGEVHAVLCRAGGCERGEPAGQLRLRHGEAVFAQGGDRFRLYNVGFGYVELWGVSPHTPAGRKYAEEN